MIIKNRNDLLTIYRNNNLFIEAGAGAGKTQFISDKVIDLILQDVDLKKIVLITFTNKAAEEMLNRITFNIKRRINEENDRTIKDKLSEALKKLYLLTISTIHSFCNKLINENSFAAEVTFNATLLEEDDEEERRNFYFSKWVETLNQLDYDKIHQLAFYANPIRKINEKYLELCKHLPEEEFETKTISNDEFCKRMKGIDDLYNEIKKYDNGRFKMNDSLDKFTKAYEEFLSLLKGKAFDEKNIISELSSPQVVVSISNLIERCKTKIQYKKSTAALADELALINGNIELKQKKGLTDFKQYYETILEIADRDINEYAINAYKYFNSNFERDEMSNNYIIYLTYLLLKSSNKIKNILANKYDVIIVDEFQDTDRFQISFIDALTSAIESRKNGTDKKTTLVVVGDPKQSIYRFRGADIFSFMNFGNKSLIKKENLFLSENYRSNNYIVNYLNDIFASKNFCDGYTYSPMQYDIKNEIPVVTSVEKKIAGVYSFEFNLYRDINPNGNKELLKASREDPDDKKIRLARLIKYLKENRYQIYKKANNPKNDDDYILKFRDILYSDFLIITHSKKDISDIANELNKLDIKTEVSGQFDMAASEIFNALYSFISFAFSDEQNNYDYLKTYFDLIWKSYSKKDEKNYNEEFKKFIDDFLDSVRNMSPYGVLMYIVRNFLNKDIFVSNYCNSDLNLYNSIIYELLENININTNCDSVHLLKEIDNLLLNMPEQQISLKENEDVVRIMNVHKSKGLESNIVIVFDSGGEPSGEVLESCNNKVFLNAKAHESALDPIKLEKLQEKIRLQYVAMSRAKSVLIMEKTFNSRNNFFAHKPDKDLPPVRLQNYYDFSEDALKPYHLEGTTLPTIETIYKQFDPLTKEIIHKPKRLNFKIDSFKLSNLNEIKKISVNSFSPSSKENHEEHRSSTSDKIKRPRSNVFGDCLHRSMELLINNYTRKIEDICEEVYLEKANEINDELKHDYIKYLSLMIESIKNLYDKMPDFTKYTKYPEYKFCSYLSESNELINGSMDLLLIKDKYIKIVDYKSDISGFVDVSSFEEQLKNKYKNQLNLYKKVAQQIYPDATIDLSIIWVEENGDNQIAHELKLL